MEPASQSAQTQSPTDPCVTNPARSCTLSVVSEGAIAQMHHHHTLFKFIYLSIVLMGINYYPHHATRNSWLMASTHFLWWIVPAIRIHNAMQWITAQLMAPRIHFFALLSCVVLVYTHQISYNVSTMESIGILLYPTQLLYFLWFYNTKVYLFGGKKKDQIRA